MNNFFLNVFMYFQFEDNYQNTLERPSSGGGITSPHLPDSSLKKSNLNVSIFFYFLIFKQKINLKKKFNRENYQLVLVYYKFVFLTLTIKRHLN